MTKPKKRIRAGGAPMGNQNAAKGVDKKTLSPRLPLEIYERLVTEARVTPGLSPTRLAERILTERYLLPEAKAEIAVILEGV